MSGVRLTARTLCVVLVAAGVVAGQQQTRLTGRNEKDGAVALLDQAIKQSDLFTEPEQEG